ncbi:response regulator [Niveispirillum sp. SYP-B3756]|uniref:response regulator n=1 Tax=Niveispirillum sp. SYP-B3756 TaxID=2662178 RepID=UPI001290D143|nr:response regulator [Niveispirillum sp. SYP-B3756]MQP65116.1 response regulator [Niveispirillum sp. SYP-B3756]
MSEGRVLIVEDDPDDEALILRALRSAHLANPIDIAHDGVEALAYCLGENGNPPSRPSPIVVLLDLKLPKIDGLEVLRQLRAADLTRYTPVVILTSSDEQEDIIRSYELGVSSYVRKPVEFQQFTAAVTQLGLYWTLINQPPQRSVR